LWADDDVAGSAGALDDALTSSTGNLAIGPCLPLRRATGASQRFTCPVNSKIIVGFNEFEGENARKIAIGPSIPFNIHGAIQITTVKVLGL
jgi:hypothetical protein